VVKHKTSRLINLVNTVWFILGVGYVLVFTMRQASVHSRLIFFISGLSTLVALLIVSVYLFVLFGGVGKKQRIEAEYPLTSIDYYMVFYILTPVLGSLAGRVGIKGVSAIKLFLLGIATGSLVATFGLGDCGQDCSSFGDAIAIWRIKTLQSLCSYAENAKSSIFTRFQRYLSINKSIEA